MSNISEYEWKVLDELQIEEEPFESIDMSIARNKKDSTPELTLSTIFSLYRNGYVTIKQIPISTFGQTFQEKEITPQSIQECVGELDKEYKRYCETRDYLYYLNLSKDDPKGGGIPFGLWIEITEKGKYEYDNEQK